MTAGPLSFLRTVLVPFLLTRGALLGAIAVGGTFVPLDQAACHGCAPTGSDLLDPLARWDGRWYVDIAQSGYSYRPGEQSNVAFFPVYPFLMRVVAAPLGGSPWALALSGLLLSNASLVAALAGLVRVARDELGDAVAARVPLMLVVFPTSVFLSAVYPESIFLLVAVSAFWAARGGHWRATGILAAIAALTRPFGIAVGFALVAEALGSAREHHALRWLSLAPAAAIGWWGYLTYITGEPLAFLLTQSAFRRVPSFPFDPVRDLFDPTVYGFPYFVGALLAVSLVLVALAWAMLRRSLALYATIVLAFLFAGGSLSSSMRYELAVFPAFFVLASLARFRIIGLLYVGVAFALSLVLGAMFARQFWIG